MPEELEHHQHGDKDTKIVEKLTRIEMKIDKLSLEEEIIARLKELDEKINKLGEDRVTKEQIQAAASTMKTGLDATQKTITESQPK